MDFLSLLILGFATQRLTAMWLSPLGIMAPAREYLAKSSKFLQMGVNCGLCVSTWVATALYLLWLSGPIGIGVATIFAIGGVCSFVNAWSRGA